MRISEPSSILVFRNGSIGNTLVALPALRALRQRFPGVHISLVLDSIGAELLRYCPDINTVIVYDKRGGDRGISAHLKLIHALRKTQPSHAILFKRFFRNGLLSYLSGARYRIGFITNGKAPFLTHTIAYDETIHAAELDMKLLSLMDVPARELRYSITMNESDRQQSTTLLDDYAKAESRLIVIHYGGQTTQPGFFPLSRLIELINPFTKLEYSLIFIGSGNAERRLATELSTSLARSKALIDLPIRVMASVIERANCFIGFNSGPAHIAAGMRTPGVVFYRPDVNVYSEVRKWKPLNDSLLPLIPPSSSGNNEWLNFLDNARRYIELIAASTDFRGEE